MNLKEGTLIRQVLGKPDTTAHSIRFQRARFNKKDHHLRKMLLLPLIKTVEMVQSQEQEHIRSHQDLTVRFINTRNIAKIQRRHLYKA